MRLPRSPRSLVARAGKRSLAADRYVEKVGTDWWLPEAAEDSTVATVEETEAFVAAAPAPAAEILVIDDAPPPPAGEPLDAAGRARARRGPTCPVCDTAWEVNILPTTLLCCETTVCAPCGDNLRHSSLKCPLCRGKMAFPPRGATRGLPAGP